MANCSPLQKSFDDEKLYVDNTTGDKAIVSHEKTAYIGAPSCIQLSKVHKTLVLVNRTTNNIPFCIGGYYIDLQGVSKNYLPATSGTIITLSTEGYWQLTVQTIIASNEPTDRKTGTFNGDTSISIAPGSYVTRIVITPTADLPAFSIGLTNGGQEIQLAQTVEGGTSTSFSIERPFINSGGTLWFNGITSSTPYILFYD